MEQSIIDDGIEQWRRRIHACIQATLQEDIFNIHRDTNYPKHY